MNSKERKLQARDADNDSNKWVFDSSIDHNGNVPLRSSTGVWKASLFIIAIEFSERLSYYGIATSLILYLTKVIHEDIVTAAKNVNCWAGVTTMMPLLGGFLADAYIGRFSTVILSCIFYLLGLVLLTMSRVVPALRPCKAGPCREKPRIHEIVFYLAIYMISVGTGGHKPSLESFGADQFDDDHDGERRKKMSFFNWWNFGLCAGLLLGVTVIVYVQENVSWGAADVILTAVMVASLVIFLLGMPFYRYRKPTGSPFAPMLHVFVAAFTNRRLPYPSSTAELHESPDCQKTHGRLLCHTKTLRFLDKAAIISDRDTPAEKQRLATVTQVEEVKLIINMIPIWLSALPFGICVAQGTTFFIKQATMLDRRITDSFSIPPASTYGLTAIGFIITVTIYEKVLVPIIRRATGSERGISLLQRIGIGMIFTILSMVAAALAERRRLDLVNREPPMSVLWLIPQNLIMGIGDALALVGLQEYFYEQVPDSMRSLGIAFYLSVIGAASFLSSVLITLIDQVTSKSGKSWFGKDLNSSRVDNFYWVLAALTAITLCVYVFLATRYSYKTVQRQEPVVDCCDRDQPVETMA